MPGAMPARNGLPRQRGQSCNRAGALHRNIGGSPFTLGMRASACVAGPIFSGLLATNAARAQTGGSWHYCDVPRLISSTRERHI